jgi:hypothetical protein
MMTKAMHQTMIDQSKAFTNTIQNAIIDALKKGGKGGYLGPAYYQPKQTPLVFQQGQSAIPLIDDPTVKATPSPQVAASSSSDTQPIQNQSGDGKEKDLVVMSPDQSSVQGQVLPVQNQQKYPTMSDSDGKLVGWDLPRDHFVIEEILEVKYAQSYQATFGGTPGIAHMTGERVVFVYFNHASKNFERFKISLDHAHMVMPIEKRLPTPPQRSAQQPILEMPMQTASQQQLTLGMPLQTAPPQQSMTMQAILTPANTVAHTRSSPQQPISQGAAGQPVFP